jgi:hypothetical protein
MLNGDLQRHCSALATRSLRQKIGDQFIQQGLIRLDAGAELLVRLEPSLCLMPRQDFCVSAMPTVQPIEENGHRVWLEVNALGQLLVMR